MQIINHISPLGIKMEHGVCFGGQSRNAVISPGYRLLYF